MPRPRRKRKVRYEPEVYHFKPAGVPLKEIEEINLTIDEYEAIRLNDFIQKNQSDCAKDMGVSQPTFHRIIGEAHRKIAEALVTGKSIRIKGGDFIATEGYCLCPSCGYKKEHEKGIPCKARKCPLCNIDLRRS